MTSEADRIETPVQPACALSLRQQNRNLLRFGFHMSMLYLAGPVTYVGNLDAVLLNRLGYSDKVANLPAAAYMWTTAPILVLFTWYFCRVRMLKPILVASYAVWAGCGLFTAAALLQPHSNLLVPALILRAMLMGWCAGIVNFFEWEILARGVDERRRGLALSLAFGLGPLLAVASSLGTQLILYGKLGPISMCKLDFPWEFIVLFLASAPILVLPAISATRYIVHLPAVEVAREPLLSGVFGGLGNFLKNRVLVVAGIAYLLVYLGNTGILPNVVLYTKQVLGEEPQSYAGYQLALRFAFKVAAGLLLGWILTRTHPRAGLLATTALSLAGVVWALLIPGKWFLASFGLLGAGELYGVYYVNYIVSSSPTAMIRRNLAYLQLLALPATFGPVLFGVISDHFGLRCSIETAAVVLVGTILLIQAALPRRPQK